MSKIRVVIKKPQEKAYETEIENELDELQNLVSGYIEVVPASPDTEILLVLNEEGKLKGLPANIPYGKNDYIVGTIVFIGNDAPEFRGLTDEEVKLILSHY